MIRKDREPAGLFQEERHRMAHDRGHAPLTVASTDERLTTHAAFGFRIKPDRRRLVIAVDATTERRGRRRNGGQ
jgi:hypothetical protein